MNRLINASALTVALLFSTAAFAEDPVYIGHHQSSSDDMNAIMQLTKDFGAALIDKNVKQLSTLMFSSDILSASLASAATVKMINDKESAVAPRHPQTVPIIVAWIPNSEWSQEKTHD